MPRHIKNNALPTKLWRTGLIFSVFTALIVPGGSFGTTSDISTESSCLSGFILRPLAAFHEYSADTLALWSVTIFCIVAVSFWLWTPNCTSPNGKRHGTFEKHAWLKIGAIKLDRSKFDPDKTDPSLLEAHTTFHTFVTTKATYKDIRVFHRHHSQADKLPNKPTPLPYIVIVHGLGGSLAQFHPLLTSLIHSAPCLGIDLPGCGRSNFNVKEWSAYTTEALAELIHVVIGQILPEDQGYVLIGHSLGASLSLLAALLSRQQIGRQCCGLIGLCPTAGPLSSRRLASLNRFLWLPGIMVDIWRQWDRIGGINSQSVARFVGSSSSTVLKELQLKFNVQSRTETYRRMLAGLVDPHEHGLPSPAKWAQVEIPLLLIGGAEDKITKPDEVTRIAKSVLACRAEDVPIKTMILPAPANHALLYDPAFSRILAGIIQSFLAVHVDHRLSLAWQLQHLCTEGKWDVKNLAKWQKVEAVSAPIGGIFRALKTLREIDADHGPEAFAFAWQARISTVVDISHESPVYDPSGLERRGIQYFKLPSVSKIPPTREETTEFVKLIDRLRNETKSALSVTGIPDEMLDVRSTLTQEPHEVSPGPPPTRLIAVHCHYGFNRTGFFICSYLIEREQYPVQLAIDTFAAARPPGIRHPHFLDELFVRYCVGL